MTGAIILYALMLQMDSLLSQKSSRVSVLARLVKKVLPLTGIFLAGSLCAILVYRGISARVWTFENQTPVTLAPAHIFMERVLKLVQCQRNIQTGQLLLCCFYLCLCTLVFDSQLRENKRRQVKAHNTYRTYKFNSSSFHMGDR